MPFSSKWRRPSVKETPASVILSTLEARRPGLLQEIGLTKSADVPYDEDIGVGLMMSVATAGYSGDLILTTKGDTTFDLSFGGWLNDTWVETRLVSGVPDPILADRLRQEILFP